MDSLYAFQCKRVRNTRHALTFEFFLANVNYEIQFKHRED
jgi:hypothetical protein